MSEYWSQDNAIVAAIDVTAAGATGTATSDVIDMADFGRVAFILYTGTVTTTGSVTMTINEGSVTGTVTTALTTLAVGTNQDNKQWILEVHGSALTQGQRYLNATIAVATATGYAGMVAVADLATYGPASDFDVASVGSITVVT